MARKRERAFAAFGAALFLITTSALTIAAIWSAHQQSSTSTNNSTNTSTTTKTLTGTQMQNFTPLTAPLSQLQTEDIKVGTGETVKPGATVTVDYTGAVASTGTIFQSSLDMGQPVTFPLNQVIPGWTQGIPGMKVGGTRRLLIPAALAYGAHPPANSGIPANADLVFDVTVHKTK
jgi:FKBP-type peptidyl-prolyl cis-trans isomerase